MNEKKKSEGPIKTSLILRSKTWKARKSVSSFFSLLVEMPVNQKCPQKYTFELENGVSIY